MMETQNSNTFFGSLDTLCNDKDTDDDDLSHLEAHKQRKREARHERQRRARQEPAPEPVAKRVRPSTPPPAYILPLSAKASIVPPSEKIPEAPKPKTSLHRRPTLPTPSSSEKHTEGQRSPPLLPPPSPPIATRPLARTKGRVKSAPEITLSGAKASSGSAAKVSSRPAGTRLSAASVLLGRAVALPRSHTAPLPKATPQPTKINASDIFDYSMTLPPPETKQVLDGLVFFLAVDQKRMSDSTRGKIKFLVAKGGKVPQVYDDSVTHIISDLNERLTLQSLGLTSITEVPTSTPILPWDWVPHCVNCGKVQDDTRSRDRFWQRMTDHVVRRVTLPKPLKRQRSVDSNDSREEMPSPRADDFDDVEPLPPAPTRPKLADTSPVNPSNPLERWIAVAEDMDDRDMSSGDEPASSPRPAPAPASSKRALTPPSDERAVSNASSARVSPNQDIIEQLQRLMNIHKARVGPEDRFKPFQYAKAIASLRQHPTRVTSYTEVSALHGVGHKTATKIMEFVKTGEMKRVIYEEQAEDTRVVKIFMGIYGIGPKVALEWFYTGLRTLNDVKERKAGIKLSLAQQLGLKHYDDLQTRMPREEASAIFDFVKKTAWKIDKKLEMHLMGSYRRGQPDCGDVDILITRPTIDGQTHAGIMQKLLAHLREKGLLVGDLSVPGDMRDQECKYMGICKLEPEGKVRRIDILTIPFAQRGAALLYFTGDEVFNRSMRLLARHTGYSLNQRGLYKNVIRDSKTQVKTTHGVLVASATEREIFDALGVPWREPSERCYAR